jgi:hypothetical protein
MTCEVYTYTAVHGTWGPDVAHCQACHVTWPVSSEALHCVRCHRLFSDDSTFLLQQRNDRCLDPGTIPELTLVGRGRRALWVSTADFAAGRESHVTRWRAHDYHGHPTSS